MLLHQNTIAYGQILFTGLGPGVTCVVGHTVKPSDYLELLIDHSTRGHLAIVAYHLGRYSEAKELCLKSLEYYEQLGPKGYLGTLKYRLALIETALRDYDSASAHVQEAIAWFDRLEMKPDYAEAEKLLNQLNDRKLSGINYFRPVILALQQF